MNHFLRVLFILIILFLPFQYINLTQLQITIVISVACTMLRVVINGIWTTVNSLLKNSQNPTTNPSSTSKWRVFRNFFFSTISTIGIPLIQSFTGNDAVYGYVNTFLSNSTTTRNNIDHRQRHNSNLNRFSRRNFRRRSNHNGGIVRIIKPTIHIHIH